MVVVISLAGEDIDEGNDRRLSCVMISLCGGCTGVLAAVLPAAAYWSPSTAPEEAANSSTVRKSREGW